MSILLQHVHSVSPRIFRVWVGVNSGRDSGLLRDNTYHGDLRYHTLDKLYNNGCLKSVLYYFSNYKVPHCVVLVIPIPIYISGISAVGIYTQHSPEYQSRYLNQCFLLLFPYSWYVGAPFCTTSLIAFLIKPNNSFP